MAASLDHPIYEAKIKSGNKTYELKGVTTDLVISHDNGALAQCLTISIINTKVGKEWIHNLIKLRDLIYVYATTGSGFKEVFRGYVWGRRFTFTNNERELKLTCYDRLIYLQNSRDNFLLKKGDRTKDAISRLCKTWGVSLTYDYSSITNKKTIYRNEALSDIIVSILKKAKKQAGTDPVILCNKGTMEIVKEGSNKTIYSIQKSENAIGTEYNETMDGMVTKVKIVKAQSKKNKETGQFTTVANIKGATKKYGTLQEILEKGDKEKMTAVKREAQKIIKDKGKPQKNIYVTCVDIPWVIKGDKVHINAGYMNNYYIVKGVEHDATNHAMTLEVKKA